MLKSTSMVWFCLPVKLSTLHKLTPDLILQCLSDYKGRHHLSPEALELYTNYLRQPKQIPCCFLFENLTLPLAEWLDSSLSHPAWVMDPAVSSLVKKTGQVPIHILQFFYLVYVLFNGCKLTHTHCGENPRKDSETLLYSGRFACIITW